MDQTSCIGGGDVVFFRGASRIYKCSTFVTQNSLSLIYNEKINFESLKPPHINTGFVLSNILKEKTSNMNI